MSLLPENLSSPAGNVLTSCMRDFGHDGGQVTKMRAAGDRFFQRREPLRRHWRTANGEWALTSDQALQLLIGLGPLNPSHVMMVAFVFGLMPHSLEPHQLQPAVKDLALRRKFLVHAPLSSPPPEAHELAAMMEMLRNAAAYDATLWIDA